MIVLLGVKRRDFFDVVIAARIGDFGGYGWG